MCFCKFLDELSSGFFMIFGTEQVSAHHRRGAEQPCLSAMFSKQLSEASSGSAQLNVSGWPSAEAGSIFLKFNLGAVVRAENANRSAHPSCLPSAVVCPAAKGSVSPPTSPR